MRLIAVGLFVTALVATPAMAQMPVAPAGSTATLDVAPALVADASPNAAVEPAAAAQTPAAPAAPAQPGFLNFFKNTEVFGSAEMYYSYDFRAKASAGGSTIPLRIYDSAHNQFTMALLELGFNKPATADDQVGYRFDMNYGPVADVTSGTADSLHNVEQAYVEYYAKTGTGLTLDFGKFVTPLGEEVIESKDNFNYSRGILFGYAIPFYHVGARLGYSPNDKVTLGATLTNGWNNQTENNGGKTFSGSIAYKADPKTTITENFIVGQEEPVVGGPYRWVSDTIFAYNPDAKTSFVANYDYGKEASSKWQGIAVYLKEQVNDMVAVTPRYEYYNDSQGFTTGIVQKLQEFTLTLEAKAKSGVISRWEYRHDMSNAVYFLGKKSQDTFTAAIIIGFSSK
jgi:hypothetical protein